MQNSTDSEPKKPLKFYIFFISHAFILRKIYLKNLTIQLVKLTGVNSMSLFFIIGTLLVIAILSYLFYSLFHAEDF